MKKKLMNLSEVCLSRLDELESIIYSLSKEDDLRFLCMRLTEVADEFTALLDDKY